MLLFPIDDWLFFLKRFEFRFFKFRANGILKFRKLDLNLSIKKSENFDWINTTDIRQSFNFRFFGDCKPFEFQKIISSQFLINYKFEILKS